MGNDVASIMTKIDGHKKKIEDDVKLSLKDLGALATPTGTNNPFPVWTPDLLKNLRDVRANWARVYQIDSDSGIGKNGNGTAATAPEYDYEKFFKEYYTLKYDPATGNSIVSTNMPYEDFGKDLQAKDLNTTMAVSLDNGYVENLVAGARELNASFYTILSANVIPDVKNIDWTRKYFSDQKSDLYLAAIERILDGNDNLPKLSELFADTALFADHRFDELSIYDEMRAVERSVGGRGFYRPNDQVQFKHNQMITKFQKQYEDSNVKIMEGQLATVQNYIQRSSEALVEVEKYNMAFNGSIATILDMVIGIFKQYVDYGTMWDLETFKRKQNYLVRKDLAINKYNLFRLDAANKILVADFKNELETTQQTIVNFLDKVKAEAMIVAEQMASEKKKRLEMLDILSKKVDAFQGATTNKINFDKSQLAARLDGFSSVAKEYIGYSNVGGQGIVGTASQG